MYDAPKMTTTALEKLLTDHAAAVRSGTHLKLGSANATFFVRIGSQSMTVERVASVELDNELTTMTSTRGDVTAVATADIAAVKFDAPKNRPGIIESR